MSVGKLTKYALQACYLQFKKNKLHWVEWSLASANTKQNDKQLKINSPETLASQCTGQNIFHGIALIKKKMQTTPPASWQRWKQAFASCSLKSCKFYRNIFKSWLRCALLQKKKTISENMKSKPPLVLSVHSSSLFFECTALNIYSYVKWINASTTSGVLAWVSKSRANMHDCRIITKEGRKPKSKLTKECSVVTHTLWLLHIPLLHQRCPGRQLFGIWTVCRRLGGRVKHRPWVNVHTSHTHIHTLGQAGSGGATWIRCIHGRRCQCALVLATQTCRHLRR